MRAPQGGMMNRLTDQRLAELLATVTAIGKQRIPTNTPCFWDTRDQVSCTYDDLRAVVAELQERRKTDCT